MESVARCKLCGTPNLGDNLQLIDDFIKQVFDVVLLKLLFDDTTQELICEICFSKLSEAFDFKSTCVDTEDIIFPYVNSERTKAIDLKEIYAKEKIHKQESETLRDWVICRLCFQPVRSKIRDIKDVPLEIIQLYIPEINFGVTTNALVCTKCFDSLYIHGTFIKSCSAVEEKTYILPEDIPLNNSCIKTEEIEIKSDETDEQVTFSEILLNVVEEDEIEEGNTSIHSLDGVRSTENAGANYIKYEISFNDQAIDFSQLIHKDPPEQQIHKGASEVKMFKCDKCKYESNSRKYLSQHQGIHRDPSQLQMYKCKKCTFESKFKSSFLRHQLVHKDASEVEMFKCDKCEYETKWKSYLGTHKEIMHRDPSDQLMFKCDKCKYECKFRSRLLRHKLVHRDQVQMFNKDAAEVKMFKCDKCKFETEHKGSLTTHLLVHEGSSGQLMFKCDKCMFESKFKGSFLRHQLVHKDASEVEMFKCDKCEYETKWKCYLGTHKEIMHRDPSDQVTFKCDKCKYECKFRSRLLRHMLVHRDQVQMFNKDAAEVKMFKCNKCKFETEHKGNLTVHQLVHRGSSDQLMFKCDKCTYESKTKVNLTKHLLTHKDASEVKMFKCDKCEYVTKRRSNFVNHLSIHRHPYKCEKCQYESKSKKNILRHGLIHKDPECENIQM